MTRCTPSSPRCTPTPHESIRARWKALPPGPYGWDRSEGYPRLRAGVALGQRQAPALLTLGEPLPEPRVLDALAHLHDDVGALLAALGEPARCAPARYRCQTAAN